MTSEVELVHLLPQPAAIVCGHVTVAGIPAFIGAAFGEVVDTLAGQGLTPTGPPFARYVPAGDGFDVEAGFPANGVVTPAGRVEAGELPGGPAARVQHNGPYDGVGAAYEAASSWIATHGHVASGPPWESYLDGPEVAEPRTVVCLPCRPETGDPVTP